VPKFSVSFPGRPYIKAVDCTAGVVPGLTPGQWIKVPDHKRFARLVRYNGDGTAYVVKPSKKTRKGSVGMKLFRLACQKNVGDVLGAFPVNTTS
jgi:hypothetical protein